MAGASGGAGQDHDRPLSPVTPLSPFDSENIFSDDYAESFNESYAPSLAAASLRDTRSASPSLRSSMQRAPSQSSVHGLTSPFADPPLNLRSSIRKSGGDATLESRAGSSGEAGPAVATGFNNGMHTGSAGLAHRSTSSASSFAGSQSQTSSGRAEGPSHPYAMYPQGLAMSRSASIASSARPLSHAPSTRGPAHPYALYTQNVNDELPASAGGQQTNIPVGFLGSNHPFHRRVGPDGEEQDIVGPDGHTEQLPPYTRYPDEANNKGVAEARTLPSIGEQRTEETSPLSPVPAAHPNPIRVQTAPIPAEPDVSGQNMSEKRWDRKSRKEKWKTRVFGVPFWLLLLIFVLVVVIAVVIGAVLGATISNKHSDHSSKNHTAPTEAPTPWRDSLTTSWMHPPPPGNYTLMAGSPLVNLSGCLQPQQQPAWSCLLHDNSSVITVENLSNGTVMMSMFDTNPYFSYGTQPPVVSSNEAQLVQDPETDDQAYAWHFQTTYDKLVVLDVNDGLLPLDSSPNRKRDNGPLPWYASAFSQETVENNDPEDVDNVDENQAWFCYWNQTFIEVLVYMGNTSNVSFTAEPGSASSSLSPTTITMTLSSSTTATSYASTLPSSSTSATMESSDPSNDGYIPQMPPPPAAMVGSYHPPRGVSFEAASVTSVSWPSDTAYSPPPPSSIQTFEPPSPPPPPTPSKKIKVEERRVSALDPPPPTCTLMSNRFDGQWRPLIQSNGLIPVVALREQDPMATPWELRKREAIPVDACGCVWNSPNGEQP
ncbi:MAG: hypothetical protein Q9162_006121 [Coniocarpon cinnabarinum]